MMLCYICTLYPLCHAVNKMKYYVRHVMYYHVKLCDGLCDDCHVYMMHICTMSWMK